MDRQRNKLFFQLHPFSYTNLHQTLQQAFQVIVAFSSQTGQQVSKECLSSLMKQEDNVEPRVIGRRLLVDEMIN